jgi:hypothetical protein
VSENPEEPKEKPTERNNSDEYTSPLHTMLVEMHEVHRELIKVGFPVRTANGILAHMILDAMMMRPLEDDEDEYDEYEDDDYEEGLDE